MRGKNQDSERRTRQKRRMKKQGRIKGVSGWYLELVQQANFTTGLRVQPLGT